MKRALIVKDPKAKIRVFSTHIEVVTFYEKQYVGFLHIKAIYLNKNISLFISDALKLSEQFPLYFIDSRGTILAKISRSKR